MISGAVYRDGVARTTDGAVYVVGVASGSSVPTAAMNAGGAHVSPGGLKVDSDGRLYVRYR